VGPEPTRKPTRRSPTARERSQQYETAVGTSQWSPSSGYPAASSPPRGIKPVVLSVEPDGRQLAELSEMAASRKLTTQIADQLPLENAAEAHVRFALGGIRGKPVLIP
jgi:NADPH:quinone reductase-like Zn-dependent oxidoreductase